MWIYAENGREEGDQPQGTQRAQRTQREDRIYMINRKEKSCPLSLAATTIFDDLM
jgi:hypothetical protein